jgi:hypothetical protein
MIKNASGRMVPIHAGMNIPCQQQGPPRRNAPPAQYHRSNFDPQKPNATKKTSTYVPPPPEYITAVVIQKRNIYMEEQKLENVADYDTYEIVSFYNNHRNGASAYTNYLPVTTDKWRDIAKYIKKAQFNVPFDPQSCETIECLTF